MTHHKKNTLHKAPTGIEGFDHLSHGGLPEGRTTLITGTAGSAKTVFATQFLAEGIKKNNQAGVFVTFEESPQDIRKNMESLDWDITQWEEEGMWTFVDGSLDNEIRSVVIGEYDFGGLLSRIEHAVKKSQAVRVSIDSLGAIFSRFDNSNTIRSELFRINTALKSLNVTTIMTAERTRDYGDIARFGVEEFVADNVIILRNVLEEENRRRTIEILKFRGAAHHKGEFPFTIQEKKGIIVIPLSAMELQQSSTMIRISSGNKKLDTMCGGGFFRDSIILVSGATGTGKTLMTTEFISGGIENKERCVLFAFEESREQLSRNAIGWGMDIQKMEEDGLLKVICEYPEVQGLDDHLIKMKEIIDSFRPNRIAVDSLSALERGATTKSFREFVIGLTSFIKDYEMAGLFTATTPSLMGGASVTEKHISTLTDSIILLRYVEIFGEMHRVLTVLKMRGAMHNKEIREFHIDDKGMHIGKPFRNVTGILSGNPQQLAVSEVKRLKSLFEV